MLKVTAPIQLNTRPQIVTAGDGLCNRMNANYQLIDTDVSAEDMLHVTTQPPEFYFGEESSNVFNSNTQINIREENVANIINNLVNRIMVAPEYNMSYQDRVYISTALKKLGIKDEKTFMKQVFDIRDEINSTNRLINLYFSYGENIKNLVEEYTSSNRYESRQTEMHDESRLHLHEEIYNRLQTGLIYSIVENYVENAYGYDVISHNEMQVAEQKNVLENILLKELQNEVRGERLPLVYKSDNYYEDYGFTEENATNENITEVINAATLLRFITNAMETKATTQQRNVNNWYVVRPRLQTIVETTLQRMESHLQSENVNQIQDITNTYLQTQIKKNEIEIINSLIEGNNIAQSFESQELSFTTVDDSEVSLQRIEQLEQNLQIQNIRQEENKQRYQQAVSEEREKVRRRLSPEERSKRQRQDALAAIESPQELIMTLKKEQAMADENEKKIENAARNATIPKEDQVFALIDQYIANPSRGIPGAIITHDDVGTLMKDIDRVEMSNRESIIRSEETTETVERISREVAREATAETVVSTQNLQREAFENLNLIHKTTETVDFEEMTEQLNQRNRTILENVKNLEQQVSNIDRQTVTTVNEKQVDTVNIERDMERMINEQVNQGLNSLTDQVYRRIESKLEMEKRRRGL